MVWTQGQACPDPALNSHSPTVKSTGDRRPQYRPTPSRQLRGVTSKPYLAITQPPDTTRPWKEQKSTWGALAHWTTINKSPGLLSVRTQGSQGVRTNADRLPLPASNWQQVLSNITSFKQFKARPSPLLPAYTKANQSGSINFRDFHPWPNACKIWSCQGKPRKSKKCFRTKTNRTWTSKSQSW